MSNALLFARVLTTRVSYVPGAAALLEPLRKWGHRHHGTLVLNDFDGDLKFELSLAGDDDSRIFWYGSLSQPVFALLNRIVRPEATVLDLGAGAGEVALFCAKRVGSDGRVVAVELDGDRADRLVRNVALNGFEQVDLLRSFDSLDAMYDEGWLDGLEVIRLGRAYVRHDVVEGGRAILDGFAPILVLEGGGAAAEDVSGLLRELGYRFHRVDRDRKRTEFSGRPPYTWAVAVPAGRTLG